MPRNPDVVGVAYIITCAASVIRPIANLDCDGAWVTGPVWAITRVTGSIITSASACTDSHRKEKEQENRPF